MGSVLQTRDEVGVGGGVDQRAGGEPGSWPVQPLAMRGQHTV
jgi:hypothetical protein